MEDSEQVPIGSSPGGGAYRRLLRVTERLHPSALFEVEDIRDPLIVLTIDDAPSPRTSEILDALDRHECRATFFLHTQPLERDAAMGRALVHRLLLSGHEIANHMPEDRTSFLLSPTDFAAQFLRAHEVLLSLGIFPRFFRAARGFYHAERMLPVMRQLAYFERFIMASFLPWDVILPFPRTYSRQLASGAFPGAILVFHDASSPDSGRVSRTVQALDSLLPVLRDRGYLLEPLGRVLDCSRRSAP